MAATSPTTLRASTPAAGRYTVLARRYRPQQFDECLGQEHVAQSLRNAIEANRVAHAYLFTGARGVGKTSMARILAKALNCAQGPTTKPCGQCELCQSIASGDDVDVIEIDGASNRGIDEVRDLRQAVNYRPSRSRHKIYIIDEVHMLTKEAFNALLKTLEEPPGHAKFIFATTEPQKIPITILSRCQRFDFAGVELDTIVRRLAEIVQAEGMQAESEALEIIARRAGGSMRDSQSLLDQLLAFGGEKITAEDVHRVMGTAGEERVMELASAIAAGDTAQCLALVETAVAEGVQLGEWVEQMLDYLRDLMVLGISHQAQLVSMPNRLRESMLEQARSVPTERALEMMDLLAACRSRMRASTYGRTLWEMTLVRLCRLDQFLNLAQALQRGMAEGIAPTPAVAAAPVPPKPPAGPPTAAKKNEVADLAPPAVESHTDTGAGIELSAENIAGFWQTVCGQLDDLMLKGMLDNANRPTLQPPATIVVSFSGRFAHSKSHCQEPARVAKIEEVASRLADRRVCVRFEQTESSEGPAPPARQSQARLRELAARHPMVKQAEQILSAKLLSVDQRPTVTAEPVTADAEKDSQSDSESNEA